MWEALQTWTAAYQGATPAALSVWLQIVADALILVACVALPPALWQFARRRRDLRFRWLLLLIAALFLASGMLLAAHMLVAEAPLWLGTARTVAAATVAIAAAAAAWLLLPQLLNTRDELRDAYRALSQRHRELMASQKRQRMLVDTAAEGVWMLDPEGRTTFANKAMAEMLGCATLKGRTLFDFVFADDQTPTEAFLARWMAGDPRRTEFRLRRADGELLFVLVSAAPVIEADGTTSGVCVMVTDISERERMAQELQRLNLELGQRVEARTRELEETNRELAREMVVREYVQAELAASNDRLNHYLQALRNHTEDIRQLNQLSDALHSCDSPAAMVPVLARFCDSFFKSRGGVLFQWRDGELLLVGDAWGDPWRHFADLEERVRAVLARSETVFEAHQQGAAAPANLLCIPLNARGMVVGVLVLTREDSFWSGDPVSDQNTQQVVRALAEHVALAGYNLTLLEQLREQSFVDPLTSLYNRRYLNDHVEREIAAYERKQQPFALLILDVDHFKLVNDRYGHDVGDEALRAIAQVILSQTRKTDVCCRLGGEEFVVLLPGAAQELALERAEIIREAVHNCAITGLPSSHSLTISIGVSVFPDHGSDMSCLLRAADQALYRSKRGGRNRTSLAMLEC
ncbi:MAG: diguanylate cyclase [Spongiibacteraceae bacterium]|nr:diguanylate cyclase [Spongiibacteraceae bacterium]